MIGSNLGEKNEFTVVILDLLRENVFSQKQATHFEIQLQVIPQFKTIGKKLTC